MSHPPTVIAIKRKAADEPLDILCTVCYFALGDTAIADQDHRCAKLKNDIASTQPSPRVEKQAASGKQREAATTSLSTLRVRIEKDFREGKDSVAKENPKPAIPRPNQLLSTSRSAARSRSSSPRPRREPRKFHWTKDQATNSNFTTHAPRRGIQKRSKSRFHSLAVFTEQRQPDTVLPRLHQRSFSSLSRRVVELAANSDNSDYVKKKPNATPEERAWRAESWSKSNIRSRSSSPMPAAKTAAVTDDHSLELAASLRDFALQETQVEAPESLRSKTLVKCTSDNAKAQNAHREEAEADEDWVYDHYVAYSMDIDNALNPTKPDQTKFDGLSLVHASNYDNRNFGVIIIDGEEEQQWEEYCESYGISDDDDDYDEEDEDENAEDHYTHDYPDEEDEGPASSAGSDFVDNGSDENDGYHGDGRMHEIGFSDDEDSGIKRIERMRWWMRVSGGDGDSEKHDDD